MLAYKQFKILELLTENDKPLPQRKMATLLDLSAGTVNRCLAELSEQGLVLNGAITVKGLEALEPYRVKRAVFIAAGFGSRMVPITLNTPKPLVRVKGRMIIDTLLSAVVAAGIEEIYIVRGYLGEQFDQLLSKYPTIKFIENPLYNQANNILSVACAGNTIQNAYVFEADLVLSNPKLVTKYQYSSNYLAIPVEKTDDWCFDVDGNSIIKSVAVGGVNCWQMMGISYWTEVDGGKLVNHVKEVLNAPGGKERYWDLVPLQYYINEYKVSIRPCTFDDIIEIDTFNELKQIDPSYNA